MTQHINTNLGNTNLGNMNLGGDIDWRTALRQTWWIYVAAFVALLPIVLFRDFTPDNELRYMSIAKEAWQNGSVFCFTNHGNIYADKPPLYLWVVMAAYRMFGMHSLWFISLFSLVPMLLTGWVMDRWVGQYLTLSQRRTGLLMLFSCGYFPALGFILRMDMLMTLWIVLALRSIWRTAHADDKAAIRRGAAMTGLYTFLALFTKGPLGLIIPILGAAVCAAGSWRKFGRLVSYPFWLVILGGCVLWFSQVYREGGVEYLSNLTVHQTVDRAHDAFHHKRPFWYYAVCIWYVMAPWSIVMAMVAWKMRRRVWATPLRKALLLISALTFVLLSSFSSKLQVYLLPIIPLMVYWCAGMIYRRRWMRVIRRIALGLLCLLFVAGCAIPFGLKGWIGYGKVSEEVAALHPTKVYVSKKVRRGENIDAYFSVPVIYTDSIPQSEPGAYLITKGEAPNKLSYKPL